MGWYFSFAQKKIIMQKKEKPKRKRERKKQIKINNKLLIQNIKRDIKRKIWKLNKNLIQTHSQFIQMQS
jgi:hypothetical protein